MSTQPIYNIKDKAPEFPCELSTDQKFWVPFRDWNGLQPNTPESCGYIFWRHWSPDAPTAPTVPQGAYGVRIEQTPTGFVRHSVPQPTPCNRPQAEVPETDLTGVRVQMVVPLPGDPFNREELNVIDIGHSDRILTVEARHAPAAAAPASEGKPDAQGETIEEWLERMAGIYKQMSEGVPCMGEDREKFRNYVSAYLTALRAAQRLHAPAAAAPASEGPSDKDMLDWLENEMTRFTCYSEPESNGDWYRLEYWKRSDNRATHIAEATGPTLRATIAAAMKAQATSKGEGA